MASGGFPRRFGSYVLLKPLARGGMGELDLAATGGHGMEKLCVIKRVLPHLRVADNVQRFREEATVMMRLSHGNLVGVLDAGREEGQFYLAMDFVEGKDLLATWNQCATRRVAFPIEIAAYVIKELARGLGYAHAYRDLHLVHRDISPANVLLSYSGEVKLTDFGLAISKLKEQQTAPGIIYGKLAYLAPEQARGRSLDGRVDIYAAGILLWEMLTGQQLFPSRLPGADADADAEGSGSSGSHGKTLDALERVRNPVVAPPSTVTGRVPVELDAVVMRALAPDPDDRYQTGEELRGALAAFLATFAPATDAAALATFMNLLFTEEIDKERIDRDALLAEASALLSGPMAFGIASSPLASEGGLRMVDRSLWKGTGGRAAAPSAAAEGLIAVSGDGTGLAGNTGAGSDERGGHGAVMSASDWGPQDMSMVATGIQRRRQRGDRRGREALANVAAAHPVPAPPVIANVGRASSMELALQDAASHDLSPADTVVLPEGEADPRVGTTIGGRYFLRRLCGEGAMGRVYEAHHVEIGRRVAIKILHVGFRHTPDVVERFRREARAASRIGHPNIVDVTDSGTTVDGAFFFVMEYLDGVDLEQLIAREGRFSIERALLIAAQTCRALAAAHAAGVIHRDLKPANVMLIRNRDEEDFVKVLDFGISKQSELDIDPRGKNLGLTRPDAAVGTPIYMAPEQVAGHPSDPRTDVYAVGELLYEMLTGVAAYRGSDIIAVFNKKATEDPAPVRTLRPEVPAAVEQILSRAMARLPAARYATMSEMKDDLMNGLARLGQTPAGAKPPDSNSADVILRGAPAPTGRVFRPPTRAFWLTGAGVIAGLGIASMLVSWRTEVEPLPVRAARTPPIAAGQRPQGAGPNLSHSPLEDRAAGSTPSTSGPTPTAPAVVSPPAGRTPRASSAAITGQGSVPHPSAARSNRSSAKNPRSRPAPSASASASPAQSSAAQTLQAPKIAGPDELGRGRAAFAKGNFPEAVRLGRAAVSAGDTVGGHVLIGDAFYKLERFPEALSEYDAALKISPAHPQARRGRELTLRHTQP